MFLFSPSQKRGFLVFFGLIAACAAFFYVAKNQEKTTAAMDAPSMVASTDSMKIYVNTADSSAWEKLPGIGAVLSGRIVKFRNRLGGFSSLNQIKDCYGLTEETFQKILPYLILDAAPESPNSSPVAHTNSDKGSNFSPTFPQENKQNKNIRLDLNTASAEDLAKLPGIGTVLSERIVKFRTAKKGFADITELQKVYGIAPEVYEAIKGNLYLTPLVATSSPTTPPTKEQPREATQFPEKKPSLAKVNLNTATMAELQNVSGIGEKTAQRIVEMRGKIGFFAKKEHIKSVYGITEENYQRMLPQLEVSDPAPAQKKNLNKITYSELMAYPLMQKTAVSALINSRKLNGYFKTWETVQSVEGLSPEMLEVLKLYFVVQE